MIWALRQNKNRPVRTEESKDAQAKEFSSRVKVDEVTAAPACTVKKTHTHTLMDH